VCAGHYISISVSENSKIHCDILYPKNLMEACFHHNKKKIATFYLTIVKYEVRIVRNKVAILRNKVAIADIKLKF